MTDTKISTNDTLWNRLEMPTWLVIIVCYGGLGTLFYYGSSMPWWVFCPVGATLVAWYGSVQHELLHGHPTRSGFVNSLFGWAPFSLWMPYHVYRDSHLAHHRVTTLAKPGEDPESYYFLADQWAGFGAVLKALMVAHNTFAGRMIMGPAVAVFRFALSEISLVLKGDFRNVMGWIFHGLLTVGFLYALELYLDIPAWYYAIGVGYPGVSLVLIRSFLEHRPHKDPNKRTVVVEGGPLWTMFFLSVNLHVIHHENPGMPWFLVPRTYKDNRQSVAQRNGGYIFKSYSQVIWRHLFKTKDIPVYTL